MRSARSTIWDYLTLGLWSLFFGIGLVPEPVFYVLRETAEVPTQRALVNSSAVITIGLTLYFAFYVLRRCREAGLSQPQAQGKALQAAIFGFVAFLEFPSKGSIFEVTTLLQFLVTANEINDTYLRVVVLIVGWAKILAWWYLFSLVVRYHGLGRRDVFARMPSIFGSPPEPRRDDPREKKPAGSIEPPKMSVTNEEWRDRTHHN